MRQNETFKSGILWASILLLNILLHPWFQGCGIASSSPILRIEPEGHMATIRQIIFTKDGRALISVSDDKTIRIWDVSTGKVIRTLRGEISDENQGKIFAAALSPDDHWLAVGGIMPRPQEGDPEATLQDAGAIRLYDFSSGEQVATLRGHKGDVYDIKFSWDGRYLASAGVMDNSVIIWDVTSQKQLQMVTRGILADVLIEKVIPKITWSSDGKRLAASTSYRSQQTIALWDVGDVASGKVDKIMDLTGHEGAVRSIIFSPDGKYLLSTGEDHTLRLWDGKTGRFLRIFDKIVHTITNLSFSSDGKYVIGLSFPDLKSASASGRFPGYVWSFPEGSLVTTFTRHGQDSALQSCAFSPDSQMAALADSERKIYLWRIKDEQIIKILEGNGKTVHSVGIAPDGHTIAWGTQYPCPGEDCINAPGVLEQSFDLERLDRIDKKDFSTFTRATPQYEGMSLVPIRSEEDPLKRPLQLEVHSKGKLQAITPQIHAYRSFSFTPDGRMFLGGGADGLLTLFRSNDGQPVARLVGHESDVMSVAISADGKWAVTGSFDQTIRLWHLERVNPSPLKYDENDYADEFLKAWIQAHPDEEPPDRKIMLKYLQKTYTKEQLAYNISLLRYVKLPVISPTLSLFMGTDHEWVAWTPEGFFAASKDGGKYIGYHLNRGPDRAADFVEVDRLYELFYRPDLVLQKLYGGDLSAYSSRIDIDKVLAGGMPPRIAIVAPQDGVQIERRETTIEMEFTDLGGGIGDRVLQINGITVGKERDGRGIALTPSKHEKSQIWKQLISLQPGENIISVTAYNKANTIESKPANLALRVKDAISEPPSLYLLAIGINKYRDHDLWLKYAVPDAQALADELRSAARPIFKDIKVTILTDEQATTTGIEKAFKQISQDIKSNDLFILYLAGHGLTFDGRFHYIPQEFVYRNEDSVPKEAIAQERIQQWLASIAALKSVVLLDTCNSGSYAEAMSRGMAEKTAIDKLTRATGRATIVASSKTQVALEGYEGHGVFTYALLEGLKGEADRKAGNGDGQISINEVAQYIGDEVPRITLKQFGYEQFPMQNLHGNNFPVGVIK